MKTEHRIIARVYEAKADHAAAEALIRDYIPFIRAEATRFLARLCTDQDDEYSIAMIAFHEAVLSFDRSRGAFLAYASTVIRNRLIDHQRRESRHQRNISLHEPHSDGDDRPLADAIADRRDHYEESAVRQATRQEIRELGAVMARFGVSFSDVADNCPKQERTMASCAAAIRYAGQDPALAEALLRTGKLPLAALAKGANVERKTLERHRKYILAMLLIQTNGYEIIRGHLHRVLRQRGGIPA